MIDYDTIRVVGDINVNFSLHQTDPNDSYILKEGEGITAPEFNMQIKNTLYQGGVFQNRQSLNKQIVLSVLLNPKYGAGETVKSLRQNLYKMLTPRWNRAIKVQLLLSGAVVAEIDGHVSGMPMNPFSKEPIVQVVVDCLSACLFAPTPVNYLPESPLGLQIDYEGSAPVGFWMQVVFNDVVPNFEIRHYGNVLEKIRLNYTFVANDVLTIDTRPGLRSVTLARGGISRSVLSAYSTDSKWIEIYEGINEFTMNTSAFNWSGVTYIPQWWGA